MGRSKNVLSRIVLFCICFVMLMSSLVPVYASSDEDPVESVGDFYDISTALAAYVNDVVGLNANDLHANSSYGNHVESPQNTGNAGAYVGYWDEGLGEKGKGFLSQTSTKGTTASTYSVWKEVDREAAGGSENYVYKYVRFGRLLADMGLDETVTPGSGGHVGGYVTGATFLAADVAPQIFGWSLKILRFLNPFRFLSDTSAVTIDPMDPADMADPTNPDLPPTDNLNAHMVDPNDVPASGFTNVNDSVLNPIRSYVSKIYKVIYNDISIFVVVPLLFAIVAFQIFMLRKSAGGQFVKLFVRIAFIVIGIPVCAMLYGATLSKVADITLENSYDSRMVLATYVDFQGWSEENLKIPTDGSPTDGSLAFISVGKGNQGVASDGGGASNSTLYKLRTTALSVNLRNDPLVTSYTTDSLSGNIWTRHGTGTNWNDADDANADDMHSMAWDLISRYIKNDTLDIATATPNWKLLGADTGFNGGSTASPADTANVNTLVSQTSSESAWMKRAPSDNQKIWKKSGSQFDADGNVVYAGWIPKSWNIFANGDMDATLYSTDSIRYTSGKLSTMSMYNYLSTSFDESSLVVYSAKNSQSDFVKKEHVAVTSIGTGILGTLFTLNMWVCLGVTGLIGIAFALMIVIRNLSNGVKLIISIPTAMMGVLKSIAQIVTYVVMMILELVAGAFLFVLLSEILVVFATVIEQIVRNVTGYTSTTIVFGNHFVTQVMNAFPVLGQSRTTLAFALVIEIAGLLLIAVLSMKYRRAVYRVCDMAHEKAYAYVTSEAFMPTFDRVMNGYFENPFRMKNELRSLWEILTQPNVSGKEVVAV